MSEQSKFWDRSKWLLWQFVIQEVVKIYSDSDYQWWKNRIQEVQWSKAEIENSERVQLWSNIMTSVIQKGNKRLLDDNGKLRKSKWYFDMEDEDSEEEKDSSDEGEAVNPAPLQLWSSINMTTDQVECLKEIVNQKKNDERNFKIRGALTSCVAQSQSS